MFKVRPEDHAYLERVGKFNEELEEERRRRAAREDPGEKILKCLQLSEQVIALTAKSRGGVRNVVEPREEEFLAQGSLPALWRRIHGEGKPGG